MEYNIYRNKAGGTGSVIINCQSLISLIGFTQRVSADTWSRLEAVARRDDAEGQDRGRIGCEGGGWVVQNLHIRDRVRGVNGERYNNTILQFLSAEREWACAQSGVAHISFGTLCRPGHQFYFCQEYISYDCYSGDIWPTNLLCTTVPHVCIYGLWFFSPCSPSFPCGPIWKKKSSSGKHRGRRNKIKKYIYTTTK